MDARRDAVSARQLKILKMDTLRLNKYLNEVMLENPVIEIEENMTGYTDEDLRARKAAWLESNDFEEGLGYFDKETELPQVDEPDYAMLNTGADQTLGSHLRAQLAEQQLDPRVRSAAEYLVGCLDENGYLLAQEQDLIEQGYCASEFEEALAAIHSLEPLGVGATSLKECLCLQLDEEDELARTLLDEIDLIVNRIRMDMVRRGDMMSLSDVMDILAVNVIGAVPDDEDIVVSANQGEPLVGMGSMAGQAYLDICRRLMGENIPLAQPEPHGGLLTRLGRILKRA